MKIKRFSLVILSALYMCLSYAQPRNMDLFLLIGQSNMAGRGEVLEEEF